MTSESNRISGASTTYVESVCRAWGWSWNAISQVDDDGIDGLVCLRAFEFDLERPDDRRRWKHAFTGGLIQAQVKSGRSYEVRRTAQHIEISFPDIQAKRLQWLKAPLPVALIYVKDESMGKTPRWAWWADLKHEGSFSQSGSVLIPLKNRFQAGLECRRPFERLANGQLRRLGLPSIDMTSSGLLPNRLNLMSNTSKGAAIDFYRLWRSSRPMNPWLGPVIVNRTGWAHMTRVGRPVSRIQNSFELLPAAARIVSEVANWQVLRRGQKVRMYPDGSWATYDFLGLSALAKWPARAASEVMVILRRQTTFAECPATESNRAVVEPVGRRIWFYSVYEPGRRRISN